MEEIIRIDMKAGEKKNIKNLKANFDRILKTSIMFNDDFKVGSVQQGNDVEFSYSLYIRKPDEELSKLIIELIKKNHPRYKFHLKTLIEAFQELVKAKK